MADAVISVVVERAAVFLEEKIVGELNLLRGVEKEVRRVSKELKTIKDVLDDAEKRGANEQSVKNWLRKLEDTTYKMEDILDEWKLYDLLKRKRLEKVCCPFFPSSSSFKNLSFRRKIGKDVQNVSANVDEIIKEKDRYGFVTSPIPSDKPSRDQSTSSIEIEDVFGRDIDWNKGEIVKKLMVISGSSQVVCIFGMGGLGKTTLAQLVYNDTRVKESFKSRAWVCVSDPFNVGEIARGIVESVTNEIISRDTHRSEFLLEKLRVSISGKKLLVVLDDVWTEKLGEWEPLRNILKHGAEGSKILVTARKEGVAKMMGTFDHDIYRPQHLTDDECWSLLRRISHSGRSEEECWMFEDVGKEIAKKCRGLPLAAKVLGSLLQCKRSLVDWENVLESEIWSLEKAEVELFPHLLFSYNELSPTLKRCFSYCAVYPKDYRINPESLIEEWRALGYLGPVAGKGGAEAKGGDYFNDLAMHSLFQDFERRGGEVIKWCKMHDIVHDFAKFLRKNNDRAVLEDAPETTMKSCEIHDPLIVSQVQEYRSLYWDKATPPDLCDCIKSVRVLRFEGKLDNPPKGIEKLIHLRWLELSGTKLSQEQLQMLCKLYFLQTLLLESCYLEEIPDEIGDLVNLRHLNLGNNKGLKELPDSICNLAQLEILDIHLCWGLNGLPEGIHKLVNLQHLYVENTRVCDCFPQGFAQLSGLRTLRLFGAGRGRNKLELLKNLDHLSGSLRMDFYIESIGDLEDLAEDAREAGLTNKADIESLELHFMNGSNVEEWSSLSSLWMDVMEGLEPNRNLKNFMVAGYKGSRLPLWISSPLNSLKDIDLMFLTELPSLPPLGKLRFLERLNIYKLSALEVLGKEFLGIERPSSSSSSSTTHGPVVAFRNLKRLKFESCNNWREWEDITAEEEESGDLSIMPCLERLSFENCRSLKKLPRFLMRMTYSLQELDLRESFLLVQRYRYDEHGRGRRSISHNGRQLHFSY